MKVPYIDYTNNYTLALTTLEEKCKNARLAAFLEQCRVESSIKALESLLIMPIQRVPRYELLLKQLIKHTPPWVRASRTSWFKVPTNASYRLCRV